VATRLVSSAWNEEKAIARRLNGLAVDHVLYAPLGVFLRPHAWRKTVSGIVQAPLPLFWGVSKSA
jgi:peptide/nickel transport system substrate-binding protein